MQEYRYCIHGVNIRLTTNSAVVVTIAQTLLRHFQQETFPDPVVLEIVFREVHHRAEIPVSVSPSTQALFSQDGKAAEPLLGSGWAYTLYRDHERTIADFHDHCLLVIDDQRRRAEGYLLKPDVMRYNAHFNSCYLAVFFALTELLKQVGLYTIHAAALERGGRGVLISGYSGRGKTTSCISLLRAGYRCLSDDHPWVRQNGTGLEVLSFPVKIDVTDTTVTFFPELKRAGEYLRQGLRKQYFYVEDVYPHAQVDSCVPTVILFPQVVDWSQSCLEPLPKSRALEELLPQGLLVYDKQVAREEFHTLSRLVQQAACYRLYFGTDVLQLPQLIDPLLERA